MEDNPNISDVNFIDILGNVVTYSSAVEVNIVQTGNEELNHNLRKFWLVK